MSYKEISKVIGIYLYVLAATLLIPTALAVYYQFFADPSSHPQPHTTVAFLLTILICLSLGGLLHFIGRTAQGRFFKREALALVVCIWFITAIIGGLPLYLSGTLESFCDSYFEAMSGLTTTGATAMHPKNYDPQTGEEILVKKEFSGMHGMTYMFSGTITPVRNPKTGQVLFQGVEAVSKAILFWRSFMQWLGGMGIVVLFVAVLPALGVGGKALFQAEVPGPIKDSITPRIKETAGLLWKIYLGASVLEIFLLMVTNAKMPLFDAMCITFSNISTGGFSVRNYSIASYDNVNTEIVTVLFMIVGSINFGLYFHCLRGKFYKAYQPELFTYLAILFVSCLISIISLVGSQHVTLAGSQEGIFSWTKAIRYGCFQSISAQTSTGFSSADYDLWPFVNQVQMLLVMFVGSMAGSTGGGIKIVRHYMLVRILQFKIESLFRPFAVRTFKVGERKISSDAAITVLCFYMVVVILSALGTFLLTVDGVDPSTALATNTCMINNIGIAFRMGGPTQSFAFLSPLAKIGASIWMVLGRLEFFAVLVVLTPGFWKERRQ